MGGDEQVAKELLALGMQPESVEALVTRTHTATEKRWARATKAVDALRRVPGMTDDLALDLLSGAAIPFHSAQTGEVSILKACNTSRLPDDEAVRAII